LNDEHWQVIYFIRYFHEQHGVQAAVRDMIKHFRKTWGREKGSSKYLHQIFPKGGPQKQDNRLPVCASQKASINQPGLGQTGGGQL